MAIQYSLISPQGFLAPAAYARIKSFGGDKQTVKVIIETFKDHQARLDNRTPLNYGSYLLNIANGASLTDMYTELKKLDQYKDSLDV